MWRRLHDGLIVRNAAEQVAGGRHAVAGTLVGSQPPLQAFPPPPPLQAAVFGAVATMAIEPLRLSAFRQAA